MAGKKPATCEIDITPTYPTRYDPLPPWPYTRPDPRPSEYGKPGKRINVLLIPGQIEYDPCMNSVEKSVRKLVKAGRHVVIVVPDVYRGVGEIMARRNGLNFLVVNTDKAGNTSLPTIIDRATFFVSKTARRRTMMEADVMYLVDSNPVFDVVAKEAKKFFPELKVNVVEHQYRFKKRRDGSESRGIKTKPKKSK